MLYPFWDSIIGPLFAVARPRVIVEIGAEEGRHTHKLLAYCGANDAMLHAIDVFPLPAREEWQREHADHLRFHQGTSLEILPTLDPYDAILIDGDHNWYTVFHELKAIEEMAKRSGTFPLVFLHDTGWPTAHRDSYADPERIPSEHRHPYERGGIIPGRKQPGKREEGAFCPDFLFASREGGPCNGVRKAVEDFLKATDMPLRCIFLPGMHGLGILASEEYCALHSDVRAFLDSLESKPLCSFMELLEEQRVTSQRYHYQDAEHVKKLLREIDRLRSTLHTYEDENGLLSAPLRALHDRNERLKRMELSRSWRWTKSLRHLETMFRIFLLQKKTRPGHSDQASRTDPILTPLSDPYAVSVILYARNNARTLRTALESILQQSLLPAEILIVDDASEDETTIIARQERKRGVHYVHGEWKDKAHAENHGASLTHSPYLLFLSATDRLSPYSIAKGIRTLQQDPEMALVDENALARTDAPFHGIMVRRTMFEKAGGFQSQSERTHATLFQRDLSNSLKSTPLVYRTPAGTSSRTMQPASIVTMRSQVYSRDEK